NLFDRHHIDFFRCQDAGQAGVDCEQPFLQGLARRGAYRAEKNGDVLRAVRFDDAISCESATGIDPQDSHQDASLNSAAPISKLAQTFWTSSWSSMLSMSLSMV